MTIPWKGTDVTHPTCVVDDCEKPSRSGVKTYCKMHYHRLYRNGTLEARRPWHRRTVCAVDGCDKPEKLLTYCDMHAARYQRNGTTEYVGVKPRYGAENPCWVGDNASYYTMHSRLTSRRGRAANHLCVDCGKTAQHWSYDHADFDERASEFGPYSLSVEHYDPRCVPCHKTFDLHYLTAARSVAA